LKTGLLLLEHKAADYLETKLCGQHLLFGDKAVVFEDKAAAFEYKVYYVPKISLIISPIFLPAMLTCLLLFSLLIVK